MIVLPGQNNELTLPMVTPAGAPIITGEVAFYLRCDGQWWDGQAWSDTEVSCGSGALASGIVGDWSVTVGAGAWVDGRRYRVYARESGGLNIPMSEDLLCQAQFSPGDGARTITVTVTDGSNPIDRARVRFTMGLQTRVVRTNSAGAAVFNLDDGEWKLAVTATMYAYGGSTVNVSGDVSVPVTMTALAPGVPAEVFQTRATGICRGSNLLPAAGVPVEIHLVTPPAGAGQCLRQTITATSGDGGTYTVDIGRLTKYRMRVTGGAQSWKEFTTPDADNCTLPDL